MSTTTQSIPKTRYADSGLISLNPLLDNTENIEIILNDFAENGNGEMEIANIEITANTVPEPAASLLLLAMLYAWEAAWCDFDRSAQASFHRSPR